MVWQRPITTTQIAHEYVPSILLKSSLCFCAFTCLQRAPETAVDAGFVEETKEEASEYHMRIWIGVEKSRVAGLAAEKVES